MEIIPAMFVAVPFCLFRDLTIHNHPAEHNLFNNINNSLARTAENSSTTAAAQQPCSSNFHLLSSIPSLKRERETTLLFITKAPRRGQEPNSVAVETTKERASLHQHQLRGNTTAQECSLVYRP